MTSKRKPGRPGTVLVRDDSGVVVGKVCAICKDPKQLSEFDRSKHGSHGLDSYCKPCRAEYQRERKQRERKQRGPKQRAGGASGVSGVGGVMLSSEARRNMERQAGPRFRCPACGCRLTYDRKYVERCDPCKRAAERTAREERWSA